jgi:hypothetical protein
MGRVRRGRLGRWSSLIAIVDWAVDERTVLPSELLAVGVTNQLRVDREGRSGVDVSELVLDVRDVVAGRKQVRGIGAAERVRGDMHVYRRLLARRPYFVRALENGRDDAGADVVAVGGSCSR